MTLTLSYAELFAPRVRTFEGFEKRLYCVYLESWFGRICIGVFKTKAEAEKFIANIIEHEILVQACIDENRDIIYYLTNSMERFFSMAREYKEKNKSIVDNFSIEWQEFFKFIKEDTNKIWEQLSLNIEETKKNRQTMRP